MMIYPNIHLSATSWRIPVDSGFQETIKKVAKVALIILCASTIVGIPLAAYLIYTMIPNKYGDIYEKAIKPEGIDAALKKKIMPKHTFQFDEKTTYHFSDSLKYSRNFRAMYVEREGQIHFNLIYLSQSQGVWRTAPCRLNGDHIGKGIEENDLDLPFDVLSELQTYSSEAEEISQDEYRSLIPTLEAVSEYLDTIQKETLLKGTETDPSKLEIAEEGKKPDFSSKNISFQNVDLPLYGRVKARVVPSKDAELRYLFIENEKQVFLASVEKVNAEITKYGNRNTYLSIGNLKMPLLEYAKQIPVQYVNFENNKGPYLYTTGYLDQIPVLKDYRKRFIKSVRFNETVRVRRCEKYIKNLRGQDI